MASLTTAVRTLGDLTVIGKTSILKTLEVLFDGFRPALSEIRTLRLGAEVKPNHVLAVQLALQVDKADTVTMWLLLHLQPFISTWLRP